MEEKTKECPACGGDVSDRRRLGMQESGVWYRCVDWFHDKAQSPSVLADEVEEIQQSIDAAIARAKAGEL